MGCLGVGVSGKGGEFSLGSRGPPTPLPDFHSNTVLVFFYGPRWGGFRMLKGLKTRVPNTRPRLFRGFGALYFFMLRADEVRDRNVTIFGLRGWEGHYP